MGSKTYPSLKQQEVVAIITKLGFVHKRTDGSHAHYERLPDERNNQRRLVTVDEAVREFGMDLLKSMIRQSGFSREEFYGATKRTAIRASVPCVD